MALRLENLSLQQGTFRLDADLTVPAKAFVAVLGPSGAGKSTLFDAIAGFLDPAAGQVIWEDRHLNAEPPGKRPVAMLFQDNNLFPHLTVLQNVGLALTRKSRLTEEQMNRVHQVLTRVGLEGMADRRPAQLSGGQISRAALARLLLQNKPLWLLDEPFSALGPALKAEMLALVAGIAREKQGTVLMITHDPSDARSFAPQSILVAEGKATGPYPTRDLLDNPPAALAAYLG